jgi:hypothetical protein
MDERVVYAMRTGAWNEGRAVLLDAGGFPETRIADVAALVSRVHVVGDRGAASALREAGVADVSVSDGGSIEDAVRATAAMSAPVIFCGQPDKPRKMVGSAVSAITRQDGPRLPVAAIMVMRPEPPVSDELCAIAEHAFVSGYGLLFSILLADLTQSDVRIVVPRKDDYKATHADVVRSATGFARYVDVRVTMHTDPAPRSWAIANSPRLGAVFCGVLQATGRTSGDRVKVTAKAGDEIYTAVELIEEASCDVVVVLDNISLVHGKTIGAQVAKMIGAAMVASLAVGGAAAPAVAATRPPTGHHAVTKAHDHKARSRGKRLSGAVGVGASAGVAAEAPAGAGVGAAAGVEAPAGAGVGAAAGVEAPAGAGVGAAAGVEAASSDGFGASDATQVPGTANSVDSPDAVDETDSADVELPQEYIAFQVWTDSQGRNHVISTGLQDHPVDTPAIPDWAQQDASAEWASARGQAAGDSVTVQDQAGQRSAGAPKTHGKKAQRRAVHRKQVKHSRAHHRRSRRARR